MPPFNAVSDHLFEGKVRRHANLYPSIRVLLSETTNAFVSHLILRRLDLKLHSLTFDFVILEIFFFIFQEYSKNTQIQVNILPFS